MPNITGQRRANSDVRRVTNVDRACYATMQHNKSTRAQAAVYLLHNIELFIIDYCYTGTPIQPS